MNLIIILFTLLFSTSHSYAYIPKFSTIISKVTQQRSKQPYTLKQNVTFYHGNTPLSIEETWTVLDGTHLTLQAKGLGSLKNIISFSYIYKDGQRYKLDSQKKIIRQSLKSNWFESYFHYKSPKKIKNRLFQHKIIPKQAIYMHSKPKKIKDIKYRSLNFIKLGRLNKNFSYIISTNLQKNNSTPFGIWIEQDTFYILKIKLPSSIEILAENYNQYKNQISFPKKRIINWSNYRTKIQLRRMTPISIRRANKLLQTNKLRSLSENKEPTDPVISQFYKNFR